MAMMDEYDIPRQIEDIQVGRARRTADYVMDEPHEHPYYEVYYLISGRCRMFLKQNLFDLCPGDVLVIRPREIHKVLYDEEVQAERFAVYFTRQYVESFRSACGQAAFERIFYSSKRSLASDGAAVEELFGRMMREERGEDDYQAVVMKSLLFQLLALLGRCPAQKQGKDRLEDGERAVLESVRYLTDHYREAVTLEEAAGVAHMSPTYFSRKFKCATGFGFKEYLNSVRLQEAARMLRTTDALVTEVALACGFSDGNYFGDVFKKARGLSPRQYRRMFRKPSSR